MELVPFLCFSVISIISRCTFVKTEVHAMSEISRQPSSPFFPNFPAGKPNSNLDTALASAVDGISRETHMNYHTDGSLHSKRIVCLYNNVDYYHTNFTPSMLDPTLCTHINYEFAILDPKTYEITPGDSSLDLQESFYEQVVELRDKHPHLKVLLSMGGWKDSTKKYSELVESSVRMNNFIEKCVHFLTMHRFDGLDIAWEYPNCWQGAIGISHDDKQNFVTFLKKVKDSFTAHNFTLSVSVSGVQREVEAAYDVPEISKIVDYVNVMTYDMHGPWDEKTGHHAQFEEAEADDDPSLNVKAALKCWADSGMNIKKINLGIPAYGISFTLKDPDTHGIGAPVTGPGRKGPYSQQTGILCYSEICEFLSSGNWTEDEDAGRGYYAYCGDQWVCYDPPMMVVRKVKWAIGSGFGGVLIKGCRCDDFSGHCKNMKYPLLSMIRMEMIRVMKQHLSFHELLMSILE